MGDHSGKRQEIPLSISLKIIESKYLRQGIILNIPKHNYENKVSPQDTDGNREGEHDGNIKHVSDQAEY